MFTSANLLLPEMANLRPNSACSRLRMLTQNSPAAATAGHVVEARPGLRATSGGSSETEKNDWHVIPTTPCGRRAVTTTTPDAK